MISGALDEPWRVFIENVMVDMAVGH